MWEGLKKVIWGRVWSVSKVAESESKVILVVLTSSYSSVDDVLKLFVGDISEAQVQTVPNLLITTLYYSTSSVSTTYIQSLVTFNRQKYVLLKTHFRKQFFNNKELYI